MVNRLTAIYIGGSTEGLYRDAFLFILWYFFYKILHHLQNLCSAQHYLVVMFAWKQVLEMHCRNNAVATMAKQSGKLNISISSKLLKFQVLPKFRFPVCQTASLDVLCSYYTVISLVKVCLLCYVNNLLTSACKTHEWFKKRFVCSLYTTPT